MLTGTEEACTHLEQRGCTEWFAGVCPFNSQLADQYMMRIDKSHSLTKQSASQHQCSG